MNGVSFSSACIAKRFSVGTIEQQWACLVVVGAAICVAVAVAVDVADAVAFAVGRGLAVAVAVTDTVAVAVAIWFAVTVAVAVAVGELVAVVNRVQVHSVKFPLIPMFRTIPQTDPGRISGFDLLPSFVCDHSPHTARRSYRRSLFLYSNLSPTARASRLEILRTVPQICSVQLARSLRKCPCMRFCMIAQSVPRPIVS